MFVVAGAGALAVVLVIWLLARDSKKKPAASTDDGSAQETGAVVSPSTAAPAGAPRPEVVFDPNPTPQASTPNPRVAADALQRALQRQKLWSTVEVIGERADIRSNVCADAGLVAMVDGASAGLRTAGLTRLRCLEQSGRVVFTRDL